MNAVVYKLIKKEIIFTFRPLLVLGMLIVTFFVQIFKLFMAQGGAIVVPMMWCWVFSLSGSVKGYGARSIGMIIAPIKRTEYVAAKYIFSIGATMAVFSLSFAMDVIMLAARDRLIQVPALLNYSMDQMAAAYPVALLAVTALQAWMLYGGACSKISYDIIVSLPILAVILFVSLQENIFNGMALKFSRDTGLVGGPVSTLALWGISIFFSAGILLFSYKKCRQDIQKVDF